MSKAVSPFHRIAPLFLFSASPVFFFASATRKPCGSAKDRALRPFSRRALAEANRWEISPFVAIFSRIAGDTNSIKETSELPIELSEGYSACRAECDR